jgi:hypothetical protein
MNKQQINYKVTVTAVPDDLIPPLSKENSHLEETSELYHFCVASRLIWPVWQIDEYDKIWIAIDRMEHDGEHYHSLSLDEGTYLKIDSETYSVMKE